MTPHRRLRRTLAAAVATAATVVATLVTATPAEAANPVTPGNFTGHGFDQCLAPSQSAMNTWLKTSPFLAAGIYIAGDSRGCRQQPNLTPKWVRTQLRKGWRLLPITLGPQASCHPSFSRYGDDHTINPRPGNHGTYPRARKQARKTAIREGLIAAPKPKPRFPAGGRRPGFPSPSAAQGQGGNAAGQTPVSPAPAA